MKHEYSIQGMTCNGCAATVQKALASVDGVQEVHVNLALTNAVVSMEQPIPIQRLQTALADHPNYQLNEKGSNVILINHFWNDMSVWQRASWNTLNCLIGCSIGDFGMIIFLQKNFPGTGMMMQMILATVAGLITSVLLETTLLRIREGFSWGASLRTAFAMSFISMVAMELAMNATDFMITGGKAAFANPMYWLALGLSLVVGFLAPFPYNYYRLKKFSKACH
jgi:copper chaperone CopZ